MKYERFEDLPVWKAAIEFAVLVYELTADKTLGVTGAPEISWSQRQCPYPTILPKGSNEALQKSCSHF
jgi:hypothetical protein